MGYLVFLPVHCHTMEYEFATFYYVTAFAGTDDNTALEFDYKHVLSLVDRLVIHTPYSWNIMCHKSEGNCGLWVLNEITLKKYAESLKKIVGAVWELPAK